MCFVFIGQSEGWMSRHTNEEIIVTLAPLLENNKPSAEICSFFSRHCSDNPRSRLVIDMFTPVVSRILKHNVDFGKYPHVRRFVQDYIQALNSQNDGQNVVHKFVRDTHGNGINCPHLRVLPNLVAVCTSAIFTLLESQRNRQSLNIFGDQETNQHLRCYFSVLSVMEILPIVKRIGTDPRCQVHQMVLGPREQKEGWLQFVSPNAVACCDKGEAWTAMIQVLLSCCYKRKKFLRMLLKSLGSCMLLALRDNSTAQEILCLMLEWQLVEGNDQCMQIVTTLQSTAGGKKKYQALCDRQLHLQELQQKCGPRKLTLPSRSTDADVMRLLSSGPFGNLEVLSLAFTRVTSACAEQLIHLQSLRYLNLWATQFGDSGLLQICEHLHNLQVLNLCETPVTDEGLGALVALKNLRKLNLNSTKLSLQMFEQLKAALPSLQEVDVRYTDAW
ncbi:C-Maf-inducing protein [Armadillidium vulgare]|nr:C-Maf-inducing protein [Armadillidium vulgare]